MSDGLLNQSLRHAGKVQSFQMANTRNTTVIKAHTVMQNQGSASMAANTM
jgi:hypothetical protein